jgi:two-component sensor histidine kinase
MSYYRGLSGIETLRGNVEASLSWSEKALKLVDEAGFSRVVKLDLLINKGAALIRSGQPGNALQVYLEADQIASEEDLPGKRGLILNNLGATYRRLKRYPDAIRIYRQSLSIRHDLKDTNGIANNHFNLAATYASQGDYDLAIAAIDTARTIYEALGMQNDVLTCELSLGHALFQLGRKAEGFNILKRLSERSSLPFQVHEYATLYLTLGKYYNEISEFRRADHLFGRLAPHITDSDLSDLQLEYFKNHAIAKNGLLQHELAYQMMVKYNQVLDTLAQQETQQLRQEMEAKYLSREKDYQIQVQNLEIRKSNRQKITYAMGLVGVTLLAFLLYRINHIRRRNNLDLKEKKEIIEKSLLEKEILLREIHHRVKNNLQFISSLLGLQSEHIDDDTALSALQDGQNRVQSMALIHQNLYQEDNLTGVGVKDYFIKLIRNLFDSYNIRNDSVDLMLEVDELNLDVDTVIPVGLIVNELVSNCLKYAFPDGQGMILVSLKEEDNELCLMVKDNGRGITGLEKSNLGTSFGYRLIKVLQGQMKATLEVSANQGTQVIMRIRKYLRAGS